MRHLNPRGPVLWFLAVWTVTHLAIRIERHNRQGVLTNSYFEEVLEGEKIRFILILFVYAKKSGNSYWMYEEENNVTFFISILFLWNYSRKTACLCALLLEKKNKNKSLQKIFDTIYLQNRHLLLSRSCQAHFIVSGKKQALFRCKSYSIFQIFILGETNHVLVFTDMSSDGQESRENTPAEIFLLQTLLFNCINHRVKDRKEKKKGLF